MIDLNSDESLIQSYGVIKYILLNIYQDHPAANLFAKIHGFYFAFETTLPHEKGSSALFSQKC